MRTLFAAVPGVVALAGVIFAGVPAAAAPPGVVLLADTDRSGSVDRADQAGREKWTPRRGAIFLPNLDDDAKRCQVTQNDLHDNAIAIDEKLVACNDAQDDVVNGPLDLADFAPLRTMRHAVSADGTLSLGQGEGRYARLWTERDGTWTSLGESGTLTANELRSGAKLALEGRDVIRNKAVWDGVVTVTLKVQGTTDSVRLRVAPLILQSDLKTPRKVITSNPPVAELAPGYDRFRADLKTAMSAAGLPEGSLIAVDNFDSWFQDIFEPTTASMPGPGGTPQVMHILLRSPNYRPAGEDASGPYPATLRLGGRVAFSALRGHDVGVVQQYTDQRDATIRDGLNATGNFESLPPYRGYELGRPLYGSTPGQTPDPTFTKLIDSQYADPVLIDTSWLAVGHADETVHVVPARNARGWTLMVADPRLAVDLLRKASKDGHGSAALFNDLPPEWNWTTGESGPPPGFDGTIDEALADPSLMEQNDTAARHMDGQVAVLLRETGLTERDLVRVPVVFEEIVRERLATDERLVASGRITPRMKTELLERMTPGERVFIAHSPGIPNGISLGDNVFGAPDPHGPRVDGVDLFKRAAEQALAGTPVRVRWIEDWEFAHRRQGEVHCVTNALRDPTRADWWQVAR